MKLKGSGVRKLGHSGKRGKTKYPALHPELGLKSRYDEIDYDYVDKLKIREKEWLNKFTEEYVNASINRENNPLHNTQELRKKVWKKNNNRNHDLYTKINSSRHLFLCSGTDVFSDIRGFNVAQTSPSPEDLLIEEERKERLDYVISKYERVKSKRGKRLSNLKKRKNNASK